MLFLYLSVFRRCSYSFSGLKMLCDDDDDDYNDDDEKHTFAGN